MGLSKKLSFTLSALSPPSPPSFEAPNESFSSKYREIAGKFARKSAYLEHLFQKGKSLFAFLDKPKGWIETKASSVQTFLTIILINFFMIDRYVTAC